MSKLRTSPALTYICLLVLGCVTGLISLLLGAVFYGLPMFYSYFASPSLIALSLIPAVLLLFLLYFAIGKAWIAFLSSSFVLLLLSAVNFVKIQIRGDPFFASDIPLALEAAEELGAFKVQWNWKLPFAALFIIAGTLFCFWFLRYRPKSRGARVFALPVTVIIAGVLYAGPIQSDAVYNDVQGGYDLSEWSQTNLYVRRGFIYPFLHSIPDALPHRPEGYGKKEGAGLLAQYAYDDIPDDKKVDVISIMLESYADLSVYKQLGVHPEVYGKFHDLQKESVSGTLIDNIFGGGTIDTERTFLTGYTAMGTIHTKTNSYVNYFNDQGYRTEGFHAGDSWFYDRGTVHRDIGFQNYYFKDNVEGATYWDSFFFPEITKLYNNRDKTVPYFAHNLSYSNHGPYDAGKTCEEIYLERGGLSEESFNILNNYFDGISITTEYIADFVDKLRERPEPVVVLIYGDHMPWLGNGESVYHDAGIDVNTGGEGFYNYYSTQYLIWANDAAKAATGNDFTGDGGSFSPCFLMNKLFELCSWKGDPYLKAMGELMTYTDVVNTPTGYFRENVELTRTLSSAAEEYWKKFRIIEYYRRHNYDYD